MITLSDKFMTDAFVVRDHPAVKISRHHWQQNSNILLLLSLDSQGRQSEHQKRNGFGQMTLLRQQHKPRRRSTTTSLYGYYLPPDDKDDKKYELLKIGSSMLTVLGIIAFFVSPLGGVFFTIMNSFIALTILLPILGFVGFQIWSYFNTVTGTCPNCQAPVRIMKENNNNEFFTPVNICFNCGTILQAKDNQIYIANTQQQPKSTFEEEFSGWFRTNNSEGEGYSSNSQSSLFDAFGRKSGNEDDASPPTKANPRKPSTTIIDVEVQTENDDTTSFFNNPFNKRR